MSLNAALATMTPISDNETNPKMEKAAPLFCKDFRQKKKFDSFRYSRIKTIELIWSEWRDSNSRPPHPKCGALSTAPHPDLFSFLVSVGYYVVVALL